jgi:hypothetical protein
MDDPSHAQIVALSKALRKRRDPFSTEEDAKLRELVALVGEANWPKIASQLPRRSARQCRERWKLYLAPDVKNDPWSMEDEQRLLKTYLAVGPKWMLIAKAFPERTANNVKNRAKQLVRRMQKLYNTGLPGQICPVWPPALGIPLGEPPQPPPS